MEVVYNSKWFIAVYEEGLNTKNGKLIEEAHKRLDEWRTKLKALEKNKVNKEVLEKINSLIGI
jgi:hypothetical protein